MSIKANFYARKRKNLLFKVGFPVLYVDICGYGKRYCFMEYTVIGGEEKVMCLECGHDILYGRGDRKFCCSKCKNSYHNKRLQRSRAAKARVLNALEKNYSILERLLKNDITVISLTELKGYGFNTDYFTSYCKVRRHDEFSCFDIRFMIMSSAVVSIKKVSLNV